MSLAGTAFAVEPFAVEPFAGQRPRPDAVSILDPQHLSAPLGWSP